MLGRRKGEVKKKMWVAYFTGADTSITSFLCLDLGRLVAVKTENKLFLS